MRSDAEVPVAMLEGAGGEPAPRRGEVAPPAAEAHANEVTLLAGMEPFLAAAFADIERARDHVLIESYIVRSDQLGRALGERLVAASRRGASARLLYDPFGSTLAEPRWLESLAARGVDVRPFSKVGALGQLDPRARNHSRMVVADGAAYTGGFAWADPWLPSSQGGEGWHDVACRLTGPVVDDFVRVFEQRWRESQGAPFKDFDTGARHPDVRLVSDTPARDSLVLDAHLEAFERARERIWIENAYFFPTRSMLRALARAADRGVDVRVILPAITDLPIVQRAARAEYLDWMAWGIRLFEYQPTTMHSKFALVDDGATVGTFNAVATSVAFAIELNVFTHAPAFVADVEALFASDFALSAEITPEAMKHRSFWGREIDRAAQLALSAVDLAIGDEEPRDAIRRDRESLRTAA